MKLFSRKHQQPQPVIPPELQPYYGNRSGSLASWRRYILPLLVVVALLLAGTIIWRIIDHSTNKSADNQSSYIQAPQNNPSLEQSKNNSNKTESSNSTNTAPITVQ